MSGHFVNQRMAPCPLEPRAAAAAWVDGRLHVWMSTQHAQGARDLIAKVNGLDAADGARHHARRRRRVRRQDHAVPGGAAARPPGQGARPAGGVGGDAQRVDDEPRPRPRPTPRRHHRRHPRRPGDPLPARHRAGLRRLGRGRRRARVVHDPADGLGRVRHRQHRVPGTLGRHQHHPRSSPSAAPAGRRRRRRSSGRSTCSPPSSGATRRRSAGST